MSEKDITVIAYDGGYRERFHFIDSINNQTFNRDRYEVLWVECFDEIKPELQAKADDGLCKIIKLGFDGPYFLSKCTNRGIKEAKGDIIVVADGDTYVPEDVLELTWEAHQGPEHLVLYIHRWDEPEPTNKRVRPIDLDRLAAVCKLTNPDNYGGWMSVKKRFLKAIGGYEEHPVFSGPDSAAGLDLNRRFESLGLDTRWHQSAKTFHPWHPSAFRPWGGYKVETQWEMIRRREKSGEILPYIGMYGPLKKPGSWLDKWNEQWAEDKIFPYDKFIQN